MVIALISWVRFFKSFDNTLDKAWTGILGRILAAISSCNLK